MIKRLVLTAIVAFLVAFLLTLFLFDSQHADRSQPVPYTPSYGTVQ